MKKMFKLIISSALVLVAALVLTACGGSKFDKYAKNLRESAKTANKIEAIAEIKDGDVVVYRYKKTVEVVKDNQAEVTTVISSYDSNYEFVDTTSIDQVELNRNSLLLIVMKEKLFENVQIENDVLTGSVNKENIKTVLNNNNLEISDNALFTFTFKENKIETIICTYKTLSNNDVTVSIKYAY